MEIGRQEKFEKSHRYAVSMSLGLNMAAGMAVFSALGYWIDHKTANEEGLWTLGGMFVGIFYCGYEVWKVVRQQLNDNATNTKE